MQPEKGLAVGSNVDAVGAPSSLLHFAARHQVSRAARKHHHWFAGAHKNVERFTAVEAAAASALCGKDGVHSLLPARVPRVALRACTLAGAQPKFLVILERQRQLLHGELAPPHFARLEGATLQDPLMLDAAPLPIGADCDLFGANDGSVRPPHVDVFQRFPGPIR